MGRMASTTLSSKGQLVLPSAVRVARNWGPGTELSVEDTPQGVLLTEKRPFKRTQLDEVFGIARSKRKRKALSIASMDAAVTAEARRRAKAGRGK